MNRYKSVPFIILLFAILISLSADVVHLKGGTIIQGKITEETGDTVKIHSRDLGILTFPKANVEKIEREGGAPAPTATETQPSKTPAALERPVASSAEIMQGFDACLFGVVRDVHINTGDSWYAATEFLQLKVRDEVRTSMGKVKMKLRGRGEVRLPPNSHIALVSIDEGGSKVTIELKGGRIWNKITPGGGIVGYSIRTPDVVAGVQGTLFKVSLNESPGSRIAVFEGSVETKAFKTASSDVVQAGFAVHTDQQGRLASQNKVDPEEIKEWTEWDQWALDIHQNISSRFWVGGAQIDAMAKTVAEDQKKYDNIMNQANAQIIINKEASRIDGFKIPFLNFAKDTGVIPTTEMGFGVLMEDPGLPGWEGPYIKQPTLPILDRWRNPIIYRTSKSPTSGNVFGEIISSGPNGINEDGKPGSDDIRTLVPYYQIPDAMM